MTIWTAIYIAYAAIMPAVIEELRIDNRLKNVESKIRQFESKRGVCCLRV